ncbi:hypothetical protein EBU71_00805 [bacterium]|nr:hypothetical protein [Candidatus Elulimicrobium humile]
MAEIDQSAVGVESPGAYYAQDFSLETLNFLTASGQRFELKRLLVEMSYYEDLYSFTASGHITITDSQGFIELFQMTGNEFIEINFGKVKNGPNNNDQLFRVYKIGDKKPVGNLNTETYTLYFCSEELLLSEQIKISKSYAGQKISDMVENILIDKLRVPQAKINVIEPTTGLYDFVIPRLKPFEAISWLSIYARPANNGSVGADMLFFETKDGYNYRSLQSMFKEEPYATYKYQTQNIEMDKQSFKEKTISVLDYEFVKTYDSVNEISSGTFANRLISIDPLTRTYKVTDFDYLKYKDQAVSLNEGDVSNALKNRLGLTQYETYDATLKVALSNAGQNDAAYFKEIPGSVAKNVAIETYVPNRTAQIALANYTVVKITIPGDPGLTVGRTVEFNLMSLKPGTNEKQLDKFYSGKYLVSAVRHIIQPNKYQTVVEISKDSVPNNYSDINTTEFKKVIADE